MRKAIEEDRFAEFYATTKAKLDRSALTRE